MKPRASFVVCAATIAVARVASANPPPPKGLPDPPVEAPKKAEAPTMVRKHDTACWAFYPSGGAVKVECPKVLEGQTIGEGIARHPSGACAFVPLVSGLEGATGPTPCPAVLKAIAKPGVIPPEPPPPKVPFAPPPKQNEEPVPEADQPKQAFDPPPPARLDALPAQQVGCGGCTTPRGTLAGESVLFALVVVALALSRTRRVE